VISTGRQRVGERECGELGGVVATDEVVDSVRVTEAFLNLRVVVQVPFLFAQHDQYSAVYTKEERERTMGTT
jgi:hypothetical protein